MEPSRRDALAQLHQRYYPELNLARTSLRQRLREIRAWRDVAVPRQSGPAPSPDVLQALAGLPQRKRACVILRYYLDLSEADTAAALGISVGTVKSQTARALQRLRPLLSEGTVPSVTPLAGNEGGT